MPPFTMLYLILLLLIGVNISSFLMPNMYMWTAQQVFCHGVIALMFAWSFFENQKKSVKNLPLMLLAMWVILSCTFIGYKTLSNIYKYNMVNFITYFNFLLILVFYKSVQCLNIKQIETVVKWLKYMVIATLLMTVLQIVGLAQFFKLLDFEGTNFANFHNNLAVGFIGNGTHLSGFLASCIPIFLYYGKREDWLSIVLTVLVLCFTGTTLNDPSISGFIVLIFVFGFWFFDNKKIFIPYVVLLILGCGIMWAYMPKHFFSVNGRFIYLKHYFEIFKRMPITGHGLGAINILSDHVPKTVPSHSGIMLFLKNLRHLHMEFFQFIFELGIIGGCLIVYLVKEFFETESDYRIGKLFKAMVLGFLVSSCFNYPAHLWIPATWAMFAYASIYNLKRS